MRKFIKEYRVLLFTLLILGCVAAYEPAIQYINSIIPTGGNLNVQGTLSVNGTDSVVQATTTAQAVVSLFRTNQFYLSPVGNDSNDGSTNGPWWSLTNAFSKMPNYSTLNLLDGNNYQGCTNLAYLLAPPLGTVIKGAPNAWLIYTDTTTTIRFILTPTNGSTYDGVNILIQEPDHPTLDTLAAMGIYGIVDNVTNWTIKNCHLIGGIAYHDEEGAATNIVGLIKDSIFDGKYQGLYLSTPNTYAQNVICIATNPFPKQGQVQSGYALEIASHDVTVNGGIITYLGNAGTNSYGIVAKNGGLTNTLVENMVIKTMTQPTTNSTDLLNLSGTSSGIRIDSSVHRLDGALLTEGSTVSAIYPAPGSAASTLYSGLLPIHATNNPAAGNALRFDGTNYYWAP